MEFNKQQNRVCQTLAEAVATLCKNMLHFQSDITVTGLLGITVDKKNVILVNILEEVSGPGFGLDPESCEGIKEFEALGDAGILEKVFPKDWNTDIYKETTLPETTCDNRLTDSLPVKEEPTVTASGNPDNLHDTSSQMDSPTQNIANHGVKPALSSDESPRGKALSLSIKYLGARDALLPVEQDLATLEDISTHLSSHIALDLNGQLRTSPIKNAAGDLFAKSEDFMSVKEESDSFTTSFINNCKGMLDGSDILPDMMDTDFSETSSQITDEKFPCEHCGLVMAHKRSLQRHQKKHKQHDAWRCDMCPQVFNRKDVLQRHIKKHHCAKELKCPICIKKFSRQDSMRRHIIMSHTAAAEQKSLKPFKTELS